MRSGLRNVLIVLIPLIALLVLPVLLVALLWLLLPTVALPLANLAAGLGLAERGVVISRLDLARPGVDGIRVAALEIRLSEPMATLRAEGITVDWRLVPDQTDAPGLFGGTLRSVRVARLDVEASLPESAPDSDAHFDWAAVLPSALRARLPIEVLQLDAVQLLLRVGTETLHGRGRLLLEPRRMALEATVESARLARPVLLDARIETDDSFRLQLLDPQGDAMLSARGAIEIDGARLTLTGGASFDTVALGPTLGLEMPPVLGDLTGMLRRDGDVITVRLDPGTQLGAHFVPGAGTDRDAGIAGVGFAVRTQTPFSFTLDDDRLASAGTLPVSFAATGTLFGITQLDGNLELEDLGGTLSAPSAGLRASGTAALAQLSGRWQIDGSLASSETGVLQIREGGRFTFPELLLDAAVDATADADRNRAAVDAEPEAGQPVLKLVGLELLLTRGLSIDPVGPVLEPSALTATLDALSFADQRIDVSGQRIELELAMRDEAVDVGFDLTGTDLSARGEARHVLADSSTGVRLDAAAVALAPDALPARLAGLWLETPWPLRRGTATLSGSLRWPPESAAAALSGDPPGSPPAASSGAAPGTRSVAPDTNAVIDLHIAGTGLDLAIAGVDLGDAALSATLRADAGRVSLGDIIGSAATLEYRAAPDSEPLRASGVRLDGALTVSGAGLPGAVPELEALRLDADAITVAIDRTVAFGYGLDDLRLQASASGPLLDPSAVANIEAAALQVGVDISDLRCAVDVEPERLTIDACSAGLLGGRVMAPTGHWSRKTGDGYLPLALVGLDLGATLALMQDAALAGTGILDGAVPLALVAGKPIITDGFVGARPPGGTLRYAADASLRARLNQPGLSLVLAAMQDFRFAELGADIDYDAEGELALGVRLVGASPDVEQGRRINFNLNVTQNLPTLLESLRLSQEIGEDLERRLQERFAP